APGAGERMLHDRHQLDVREAEVLDVRAELLGRFPVREALPPGAEVDLVDRERPAEWRVERTRLLPRAVAPLVRAAEDDGRGLRRLFGRLRDGVGAQVHGAVLVAELELVVRPFAHAG